MSAIRRILILDTETQGLDPAVHQAIEVACVIYDVAHGAPVDAFSALIYATSNDADKINRIPVSLLSQARQATDVWDDVAAMVNSCDAIVAHRAEFDRSFVRADLRTERPWVCSKYDIEWPASAVGDHLVHLALALGVPVFTAHRAMADVDTLVRCFQAASKMCDVQAMLARAMLPRMKLVSLAPFSQKDAVKAAGFSWDGKEWSRRVVKGEPYEFPWKVREVPV